MANDSLRQLTFARCAILLRWFPLRILIGDISIEKMINLPKKIYSLFEIGR